MKLFKTLSIKNLIEKINNNFKTFPISSISALIIFIIFELLIYWNFSNNIESNMIKLALSLSLLFFLSFWIYLFISKFEINRIKKCLLQILAIIFCIAFYFSFPDFKNLYFEELVYIIITFIWVISFVFISLFIKDLIYKKVKNDDYYSFFNELIWQIVMSIIAWLLMLILWFIALSSIFTLFELWSIIDKWETYWSFANFSLSLFAPFYFLSIAHRKDAEISSINKIKENKFYSFLNNYIAIPAIIVYFFILYAYSIKVLINFSSWPEGIISWMIIWFSLFWYLVYIFSYAFEEKLLIVRVFRKVFPYAVFLQTPMLFYAIYLRIAQYDLTINRYLVVVFAIYLVIISVYLIFSKNKLIFYINLCLSIFILIISIWPWWVYSLAEYRQVKLLEKDLTEANILEGWRLILPEKETDIDPKLSWKIYEKLNYLCNYHHCDSMKSLFPKLIEKIKKEDKDNYYYKKWSIKDDYNWINSYTYKNELIKKLKVKAYYESNEKISNYKYIRFDTDYEKIKNVINIKWYDYLIDSRGKKINSDKDIYFYEIDIDNSKITIYKDIEVLESFDLSLEFEKIYNKNKNSIDSYWRVKINENIIIEKSSNKLDMKIIFDSLSIKNPKYKWEELNKYFYIDSKLLIREK